ncbi:MAG: propionate--CoA ligase [Pseudomonadota bacterium]
MSACADFHARSLRDREAFWLEQSRLVDWDTPPALACDDRRAPFTRWFGGGTTNLCHNAVDRHLADRADQPALIHVSTETGGEQTLSFAELHAEVQRMAAAMRELGVAQGDRVLIYMPMVLEAVVAMLACVRIGAIHCVVFGGFASGALASRLEDATPRLVVSADAGSRGGKVIPYKPLLDAAIELSSHKPPAVLLADRGLAPMDLHEGRDHLWSALRERHLHARVPCTWVDSTHPSYILYTSGTTGKPKGVQRDTGGYAVALAASMQSIYGGKAGETFFSTSDIGWVVGHSYIVYGPLLAGMSTILYEGLPTRGLHGEPDGGIWWRLVETYKVSVMFSSPTAVRVLKKQDEGLLKKHDLSSLRALFLAGEPLDEPTAQWISRGLGKPVIDNYWQTESGWPILGLAHGVEAMPAKFGSPGVPVYGFDVKLVDEATGEELTAPGSKGVLAIAGPTPPGFMQTVWNDDARFVQTYWRGILGKTLYSTFDWAVRDADGYYFILGRTDDVINVAGHRLGTREIEESLCGHAAVAEAAVVGVAHGLKGQVAVAVVVLKQAARTPEAEFAFKSELARAVDLQLGAIARPEKIVFVQGLPKTRSGKILRRVIQAVLEGREPGDLTTIEDASVLRQIAP